MSRPLILVADRETETLTEAFSVLEPEGFDVATCPRALDALKYAAAHKPDLVLVGRDFPDMDGIALLARIKEVAPSAHLMLLAAPSEWPIFNDLQAAGIEGVMPKPIPERLLIEKVEDLLER